MAYVSLDKIVSVESASVKDVFTLGKLPTIAIRKADVNNPNVSITELTSVADAQNIFGINSDISKFALKHFGVVSKNATVADKLFVYDWSETGHGEAIKGAKVENSILQLPDGDFGISINGVVENFNITITGVTSLTELAEEIQTKINASDNEVLQTATFIFNPLMGGFLFKLQDQDEFNISFVSGVANDIHNKLGMTEFEGAKFVPYSLPQTFDEVLKTLSEDNGGYYLVTTLFKFSSVPATELEALKDFGTWLHSSRNRFAGLYSWRNKALLDKSSGATDSLKGYNGLIIEYETEEYQNGYTSALISSLNLSNVAGNVNIAFNDASIFPNALNKDAQYDALIENRVNAPVKFGILGQSDIRYMPGLIMGSLTDSINVYICNSYLKFAKQIALFNMLASQPLIGLRDKGSEGIIMLYLNEVFESAVNSRIIATGSELTVTEKASLVTNFPENGEKAIEDVQNVGYYYEVSRIDTVKKEMYITEAYMANMPVRKFVINSFILGA